jgi:dynein heavy chain 1
VRALYEALRCNRGCTLDILVQILVHEGLRIFHDRLVNAKEKNWANETIDGLVKRFFPNCDLRECLRRPLIFSSWLGKEYSRIERDELTEFVKAKMSSFNEEELGVPLVVFDQMLDHVLRIDRVLKQPMGHSLLVGASGAGKTVMTKFVAWLNGLSVFQIKAHRKYGQEDFEADLRKVMKRTGCQGESVCFIFDESNALSSGFLELMNALLASGEVPGLFEGDDWVSLMHKCREAATKDGLMLDTEEELYKRFIEQVRRNLHVVFTMNPSSPDYGSRSASSPALFNRCVVDWVGDWDQDALVQIATHFTLPLAIQEDERRGLVEALMYSHDAAHAGCLRERRIREKSIFVTPRHYVDAVNQFVKVFEEKKSAAQVG